MWRERRLVVGEDTWTARPLGDRLGYGPGTYELRLGVRVAGSKRKTVGPTAHWHDDAEVTLQPPPTDRPDATPQGVKVHWQVRGPEVRVLVDYGDLGRAEIRATAGDLGKWIPNRALQENVRRGAENPGE
jgi:hypothetical protein